MAERTVEEMENLVFRADKYVTSKIGVDSGFMGIFKQMQKLLSKKDKRIVELEQMVTTLRGALKERPDNKRIKA